MPLAPFLITLQDMEEEQVMVARMLHQLTCDDLRSQFEILRAARTHLELGGPARMRHTLPALAFCALKALRRLLPGQQQKPADTTADSGEAADAAEDYVTAESALQWLLEVALQLAEVPAPMPALRLLLVCAHVSSEEAGLEMLAYEFFEQVRG
jgi:vacuolar protein sorting-associated protein 35